MPSTFVVEEHANVTAEAVVYTGKTTTEAIVIGFHIANMAAETVSVIVKRGTAVLNQNIPIPVGSTLVPIEGKLVVEDGETVTVEATGSVDVNMSILELTP